MENIKKEDPEKREVILLMAEIWRSPVEVGSEHPIIYDGFCTFQEVVQCRILEPSTGAWIDLLMWLWKRSEEKNGGS